ncbi:c-type cytochrome [Arcticibacter sp. MXS-1]|uniref:c-type cytochrome n=1 Tax=Arcticibacter sp. MXS-1 TaxID=3341726 RepID=UPI0035A8FA03
MRVFSLFTILSICLLACGQSPKKSADSYSPVSKEELARGKALFEREDCGGCHAENEAIVGPSFRQLAAEYEDTEANFSHLAHIAIIGVKPEQGIWGSREMTPHPNLKHEEAEAIVKYMLSFPADPNKPFLHNSK